MRLWVAGVACTCVLSSSAIAGDLTPPAGPPGATMRTLDEVEPRIPVGPLTTPGTGSYMYRISTPGSYYLTGDLIGEAGKIGISIGVGNVTLDLNGFTMHGDPGAGEGISIVVPASNKDVRILNGNIRGWGGGSGIAVFSVTAINLRVERVAASGNGGHGLSVGEYATVEDCVASNNIYHGIHVGKGSIVRSSMSRDNGKTGIVAQENAVIESCIASGNGEGGISALSHSVISNSVARLNTSVGIEARGGVIRGCSATTNSAAGITGKAGTSIVECASNDNGGDGFWLEDGSTLTDSVARSNTGNGALALLRATVRNSTFESNTIAGIRALGYCHLRENTCSLNLSGIRATGQANRIEGNMTMANTNVGILVEDDSNFILRNYALSNGMNFNIAANNMFGTLIGDVATMNAAPNNSFNVGN